ncbi:hypothetical protein Tco_0241747 [Tanacetum coccineum]
MVHFVRSLSCRGDKCWWTEDGSSKVFQDGAGLISGIGVGVGMDAGICGGDCTGGDDVDGTGRVVRMGDFESQQMYLTCIWLDKGVCFPFEYSKPFAENEDTSKTLSCSSNLPPFHQK